MKKIFLGILFVFYSVLLFSQTETEGDRLFKQNQPENAIPVLEAEIENGTNSINAFNYLGLSYLQTGDNEKAAEVFQKGLLTPKTNKKILAYNLGNTFFFLERYEDARKNYSLAVSADPNFYDAVLNRANCEIKMNLLKEALEDYRKYIQLQPESVQAENIRMVIELLETEIKQNEEEERIALAEAERIAEEERLFAEEMERQRIEEEKRLEEERRIAEEKRIEEEKRLAEQKAEEERRLAEQRAEEERLLEEQRRAEEERRRIEAERRRKLLEDVAGSLQNSDTTNISSGAEDIIDYDYESELD